MSVRPPCRSAPANYSPPLDLEPSPRIDYITSRDLLGRAAALLPERSLRRFDLLPNLGAALADSGRTEETEALLSEAVEQARGAGSERDAVRAAVQLLSGRVYRSPTDSEIESPLVEARAAADVFESLDDDVGLAEAALAISYLESFRGQDAEGLAWASKALRHALAAGRPREATQAAGDVVESLGRGAAPVRPVHGERVGAALDSASRYPAASATPCWRSPPSLPVTILGSASTRGDGGTLSTATVWHGSHRSTVWRSPTSRSPWARRRQPSGGSGRRGSSSRRIGNIWWVGHGRRIPVRSGRSAGSAARVPPARRRVRGLRPDDRPGDPDPTPTAAREGPPAPRVRPRGGGRREARAQARRSPPTWCSITRTRCSCSPTPSTSEVCGTTLLRHESTPSRSFELRGTARRLRA